MDRIAPEHTYEQVVQAEIANEILNTARGLVLAAMRALKATNPARAAELFDKSIEIYELQRSFLVTEDAAIADIIATWGERIRDPEGFIRSL